MRRNTRSVFLLLILAETAHSVEEYAAHRSARDGRRLRAWIKLENSLTHTFLAVSERGYFPGVGMAPLLMASSAWLMTSLAR